MFEAIKGPQVELVKKVVAAGAFMLKSELMKESFGEHEH